MLRYTDKQAILAAWGLGLYWGNHQVQDKLGQLISHVKVGGAQRCTADSPSFRSSQSTVRSGSAAHGSACLHATRSLAATGRGEEHVHDMHRLFLCRTTAPTLMGSTPEPTPPALPSHCITTTQT